ncbi:MAG: hypothetical protein ED859_00010 [Desulfuromonadales bacterium]|nr:MAG: hypothetical protein ED859_00010 [Desulfuromonadales bacterium]
MLSISVMVFSFFLGALLVEGSCFFTGLLVFLGTSISGVVASSFVEASFKVLFTRVVAVLPLPRKPQPGHLS